MTKVEEGEVAGVVFGRGGLDWELGELRVMCQEGRIGRGGKEREILQFFLSRTFVGKRKN